MYQETNGGNATKKQDLLLFFGLLALVIFARMLMNAVNSIPKGLVGSGFWMNSPRRSG